MIASFVNGPLIDCRPSDDDNDGDGGDGDGARNDCVGGSGADEFADDGPASGLDGDDVDDCSNDRRFSRMAHMFPSLTYSRSIAKHASMPNTARL